MGRVREQVYADMLSDMPPAVAYWATGRWESSDRATIIADDDESKTPHTVTLDTIRRGWGRLVELERAGKWSQSGPLPGNRKATQEAEAAMAADDFGEVDYDAATVDAVVQLGLFGRIVYG